MKNFMLSLFLISFSACSTQSKVEVAGQQGSAGVNKLENCIACHGADGRSGKEGVPPLANRSYDELVAAMERVRDSYSPQPLMGHTLSDDEIQELAKYFSAIQ